MIARLILPYARAYAALYGGEISDEELRRGIERRAAGIPFWGACAAALGAWAIRWWAPLFLLGTFRRFESLSAPEADKLLHCLQFSRLRAVKGLFLALKVIVLPLCYGGERHLSRIGYKIVKEKAR